MSIELKRWFRNSVRNFFAEGSRLRDTSPELRVTPLFFGFIPSLFHVPECRLN
jgi:hypothetical protein